MCRHGFLESEPIAAMLEKDKLYKMDSNVLMRYESNIESGMFFMYNIATDTLWTGNLSSYVVLRLLTKTMSLQQLYTACRDCFVDIEEKDLILTIQNLLDNLVQKGFIIEYGQS